MSINTTIKEHHDKLKELVLPENYNEFGKRWNLLVEDFECKAIIDSFTDSDGEEDGMFYGLALDVDNEPELSEERMKSWSDMIKKEIGL